MVDETTDVSTVEQASICVRYVMDKLDICEEFLGFCALASTDSGTITSAIVDFSKSCGLDMSKLVGKGFDGAANMSGHVSGVSVRLEELYPNAKYFTHCRNHALNLAIVASCNQVPDIPMDLSLNRRGEKIHQHRPTLPGPLPGPLPVPLPGPLPVPQSHL